MTPWNWFCIICLAVLIGLGMLGCSEIKETGLLCPPVESMEVKQKRWADQKKAWLTPQQVATNHYLCKKLGLGTAYAVAGPGITHVWCVPE